MFRTRILPAVVATGLMLVGLQVPADAGVTALDTYWECNDQTGDYDVTFTIVNGTGSAAPIVVLGYQVDNVDQTPPTFVPNPLPGGGMSEATTTVPGSTTGLFIEVEIQHAAAPFLVGAEETLDGDCEAVPTTTTTTAARATTTSTNPPAAAQVAEAQPRFTG